jgi:hypothetical protein
MNYHICNYIDYTLWHLPIGTYPHNLNLLVVLNVLIISDL